MENTGLHININSNFLVSGVVHDVLKKSGKYICAVCYSGVGNNAVQCSKYMLWVYKGCIGITKRLVADLSYVCHGCNGEARPINGRTVTEVDVDGTIFNAEAIFAT